MTQEETQQSVPITEKSMTDKEMAAPVTVSVEKAIPEKEKESEKSPVKEGEATGDEKVIVQTESFKEESYVASDLQGAQKKALEEFKELVKEALNKREFTAPPTPKVEDKAEETKASEEQKTQEAETHVPAPEEAKPKEESKDPTAAPVDTKPKEKSQVPDAVTVEKPSSADEDGTKTVEAIEESIVSVTPPDVETVAAEAETMEPEEVSIWGIPLLQDERSDVILLKFLRARDFKVKEAFTMLKNTVQWRKENNIDELVKEELDGSEFENMVFPHGVDKEGHVVIYSSYGEFKNKELFSEKEKLNKFLKWRIQLQERCVRALDFTPSAKSSFVFVSDFRNAPGLGKRVLWQFIRRAVKQFEDNYPEFAARELFINVPWWYIPYYKTFGSIVTSPRTRSKMVLAGPSKSADTIFKYVAPEQVPIKYGGLCKEIPLTTEETVIEAFVKPAAKYTIDIPVSEVCTLSWDLRVLGADVSYGAQFEPTNEESYTVIVSKNRKIGLTDKPVIAETFKVSEPGKVVITIDNQTSKKKKVLYKFKTQSS